MSKSKEDKHVILSKEGVKITDYQFHYLDVLKTQQTRQLLRQHLKSEHNLEPLDFLDAVEKLRQLPFELEKTATHAAVVKEVLSIFDTYVAEKSPKEINISAQVRVEVETKLGEAKQRENPEKWMLDVKPSSLYSNIADTVMLEMEKDSFPRFVRSAIFLSFIKNQTKAFIQSIGNLKTALEFDYADEDFLEHIVKDRDFEFMDRLMEDRYDWELVGSDKQGLGKVQAFWSNKNYLPNVSYMKKDGSIGKNTAILPYSLETVMRSVVPGYNVKHYDANVSGFHQYKYYTNEELRANPKTAPHVKSPHRSCAVVRFDVVMPFPMTTLRRYLVCSSITYDPEKQMMRMLHKPCELTTHPLGKKEYEMKDFQCWFLKRLDGERTLFTQIHLYNCRGWASSPKLQKLIIFDHGRGQQKGFKKVMDIEKAGKAKWDPNDYLIKLLEDAHIPEQDAEFQKTRKRFSTFNSLLPINQSLLTETSPLSAASSSEEEKKKAPSSASSSVAIEPLAP